MSKRAAGPIGLITVEMDEREWQRLRAAKGCTGQGGAQKLIHRLREGLKGKRLTVRESDLPKILAFWQQGRGGFQRLLPIRSLREYLPSVAPLFAEQPLAKKEATRWVYFRVKKFERSGRIKIGGTYREKRRDQERFTDNPEALLTLLKLEERPGCTERELHARWSALRIRRDQEWFWFDECIEEFIREEALKQARPEAS